MGLLGDIFSSVISSFGEDDVTWYCDGCHAVLNEQDGFSIDSGIWVCTECGDPNDVTSGYVFESEEAYRNHMGIPRCPYCGGMVVGDAPDARHYFNCDNCNERFFLEDGELVSVFARRGTDSSRTCENCWMPMDGGEYTAPWENGNNPDGYVKCPHCGHVNFIYED